MTSIYERQVQDFKQSVTKAILPPSQLKRTTVESGKISPPPTTSETDYKAIQDELRKQSRQIDLINGDGNCLFRSISKELFGRER